MVTEFDTSTESTDSSSEERLGDKRHPPEEQKIRCAIVPRDGLDKASIINVEADLKEITQAERIYSYTNKMQGKFRWWIVHLTTNQLKEIKEHKEIVYAAPTRKVVRARVVRREFERTKRALGNDTEPEPLPMLKKKR